MWNDYRTYQTVSIDPQEKRSLLIVLNKFKQEEGEK